MKIFKPIRCCLAFLAFGIQLTAQTTGSPPTFGQRLYVQVGGGIGFGAESDSENGPFGAGALAFGLRGDRTTFRFDARALNTPDDPLVTFGAAFGITSRPPNQPRLYLLGAAGFGFFAEEGDPANHIGAILGLVAGRHLGLVAELRYDYILSDFTYYGSRGHHLLSLVVGLRLGALEP